MSLNKETKQNQICLHTDKWFQVFLFNTNISI